MNFLLEIGTEEIPHWMIPAALEHLAKLGIKPDRKFIGRAKQRIAFVSDPDGNSIELMEIPPESEIYRTYP